MPRFLSPKIRRVLLLVLLLAGVYLAPRAVALHGVQRTFNFANGDHLSHVVNLILLTRAWKPGVQRAGAFIEAHPDAFSLQNPTRWPRGTYLVATPFAAIFGASSIWTVQLTNGLFSALLALGVVLLGRYLMGLTAGAWAAALVLLAPPVVASSWYLLLDLPLAAMTIMGIYMLLRCRGFTAWAPTIAFAAWSVLGLYTKPTYGLYLAAPCVVALIQGLWRSNRRGAVALRASASALLGLGLYALLLQKDLLILWQELTSHFEALPDHVVRLDLIRRFTLEWFFSVPTMAALGYPWPLLLPVLPGLVLLHHPRARIPARGILLALFWGTVVALTLLTNRMERYLLPLYPLFSLLAVWGILRLSTRRWRTWILTGVVVFQVAILTVAHQNPPPWIQSPAFDGTRRWMYDMRMPSREEISGLRQLIHNNNSDYRQLDQALKKALAASQARSPLGVTIRFKEDRELVRGIETTLRQNLFIQVAQLERRRLLVMGARDVISSPAHSGEDKPEHRDTYSLLVLHDPSLPARVPGDTRTVVASFDSVVTTDWGPGAQHIPVRVTLLER